MSALTRKRRVFPLAALVLVLLGVMLLLDQLGTPSLGAVFARWWPLLLVLAGIAQVAGSPASRSAGAALIVVGIVVLLTKFGMLDVGPWWRLMPLLLGVYLLVRDRRGT